MQPELSNLVALDWDDTLFPTSNITKPQITIQHCAELIALSKLIYCVLTAYIDKYKACRIVIVSASKQGSIEESLSIVYKIGHFSSIYNLLFIKNQIKMIHPSNIHFPFMNAKQVISWKRDVFCSLIKHHFSINNVAATNTINSFISIGDSIHEFKASESAVNTSDINLYLHRIKLIQHPSLKDMISEMKLLLSFCGEFELSSKKDKANIIVDYGYERKIHMVLKQLRLSKPINQKSV